MQISGLNDEQVRVSRERYGSNVIPESEPTTFREAFLETFGDPMIRILLAIVVIMLIMYGMGHAKIYEPVGTVAAILIVAFVTAKTSVASDTKYRELKESAKKDTAKIYRNGNVEVLSVDEVVVRGVSWAMKVRVTTASRWLASVAWCRSRCSAMRRFA